MQIRIGDKLILIPGISVDIRTVKEINMCRSHGTHCRQIVLIDRIGSDHRLCDTMIRLYWKGRITILNKKIRLK